MGRIFTPKNPQSGLTTGFELVICALGLILVGYAVVYFAPGLSVGESKQLQAMEQDNSEINNVKNSELLDLPSSSISSSIQKAPRVKVAGYAWNGQTPIIVANGGPFTTSGSLMEKNGVNLQIIRQDWLTELKRLQLNFITEYNKGKEYPSTVKVKNDKGQNEDQDCVFGIMIMGDGAPFYVSSMNKELAETFGEDKYHVEVVGAFGMSNGEDKLIGPAEWKSNPKSMEGALITTVLGDGDWVTALNFCFANGLKVNSDHTTYDPNAVNFYPSADDDYINSANELIASVKEGFTVELREKIDGKLTGKTVNKGFDGCATWTPGDKMVFDALKGFTDIASTKDFPNQMATTLIVVKEWAATHSDIVSNVLKSAYTASNQMKQYDEWRQAGAKCVAKTFAAETPEYWYSMFKGQKGTKAGVPYNMGGTRCLTYADAMQYYGITDGVNRYKSVYNQVSNYLTELNPFGFNEQVGDVTPYEKAVNLKYLRMIDMQDETGVVQKFDYTETKTNVLASGNWNIQFSTGSDDIQSSSNRDLDKIYNLLMQSEQSKVTIVGHTDNTGSDQINIPLSKNRANAVVTYLVNRGISRDRIQSVDGKGSTQPVASNSTNSGKALNRRVTIQFLD